ncbi:MAG: V4R domain-containing protein [archaeon]
MLRREQCLLVKNEVFNEISNLAWGSSVLVLDETHFESILFLDALLRDALPGKIRIVSPRIVESSLPTTKLNLEQSSSLNDISIAIAQIRDELRPHGVIVHHYLPHVLIRENENEVLKMLEFWAMRTAESGLIEFYTLPLGTFPTVERKAASMFSGELDVKFAEGVKNQLAFQIKKICKPEYHLADFLFTIKDDRLLIKWGDIFTDHISIEEATEIRNRMDYLRQNLDSIRLMGGEGSPGELSTYESWLLSQVQDKPLREIELLFPDVFEEVLETLARLNLRRMLRFEEGKKIQIPPAPEKLSFKSRLGLKLPSWFARRALYGKGRYITMDAFVALRDAIEIFTRYSEPERAERIAELERYYQELSSRKTAVERIVKNQEDPRIKFDLKYFKTVVSLALQAGFHVSPRIYSRPGEVFEISIEDCPVCRDRKSARPFCDLISGVVRGVSGVCFKRRFSCEEIKCVATGDSACVFLAKAL